MFSTKKTGMSRRIIMCLAVILPVLVLSIVPGVKVFAAGDFSSIVQTGATTGSIDLSFKVNDGASYERYTALVGTSKTGNFEESGVVTAFNKITIQDLAAGSTYYVKIVGCDADGNIMGSESDAVAMVTAPSGVPSLLTQTASGTDSVTIGWGSVSGASGYIVEYMLTGSETGAKEQMTVGTTSATITGILASKTYTVMVYPYRSSGSFKAYDGSSAATLSNVAIRESGASGTPKGTVTGLKQTDAGTDKAEITFNKINDANAKYTIFLSDRKDSGFTAYDTTDDSPYVIDKLTPGKTYYVKVAPGYMTYSNLNETYVTKYGEYSEVCEIVTAPDQTNATLKQTAIKKKAMTISWTAIKGATGYIVEYYESGVSDSKKSKNIKENSVTLKGLTEGSAYTVYVTAYRKASTGFLAKDDKAYIYKSNLPLKPGKCKKPVVKSIYKSLKKVVVSTEALKNAEGYEYQLWKDSKDSGSSKVCAVVGKSHSFCDIKDDIIAKYDKVNLKVRVRGYISIGGKKIYGKWSAFTKVQS